MLRVTMAVLMVWGLASSAQEQTEPSATIDCVGVAEISFEPDYVDFWLTLSATGENLEGAVEKTLPFEQNLLDALEESALRPDDVAVSGVSIADLMENRAVVSARLRFPMVRSAELKKRSLSFASLCDKIKQIGVALEAVPEGPFLRVTEEESAEQDAIARATENALYKADAVAMLVDSQIFALQTVSVLDVTWNDSGTPPTALPDVIRVTCRARVKVVYKYRTY